MCTSYMMIIIVAKSIESKDRTQEKNVDKHGVKFTSKRKLVCITILFYSIVHVTLVTLDSVVLPIELQLSSL